MENTMNAKELNHARGLEQALRRKVELLRDQAAQADADKDGRSKMAVRLREQANAQEIVANDLKAAVDAAVYFG
jgi:hypothetical protein